MAENSSEQEPSIEEILASIRQIISDDEDDSDTPEEVVEDPVRHDSDDVLELTEDDLLDQDDEFGVGEEEDFIPEVEDEPEPEPEPDPVEVDLEEDDFEPEEEEEIIAPPPKPRPAKETVPSDILSSSTQSAALGSLSKLTKKMPINSSRDYDGITLEDIVREMLHPMLREWMDDNLPPMVERIVQKELDKLARRALDD